MQHGSSKGEPHARQSKFAHGSVLDDAGGAGLVDDGHVPLAQQGGEHSSHPSSLQLHTLVAVHDPDGLDELVFDPHVPLAQQAGEHSSQPSSLQLHTSVTVHFLDVEPMDVVGAE